MAAYYNEFDKQAAQWLRNLIAAGHIAPGDVDERSILDVSPDDLRGYTQCHFFAGIGVWSYALRRAGWADDRPVWTGSCPCQPFSGAGPAEGFADKRHLWPYFAWLIEQHRPPVLFGEQVASKTVEPWVDLVHADLEALDYAFGAVPFPAASVCAPHIRDRLYWVGERLADTRSLGLQRGLHRRPDTQWQIEHGQAGRLRATGWVADADLQQPRHPGRGSHGEASSIQGVNRSIIVGPGQSGRADDALCRLANDDLVGFVAVPVAGLRDQEHHAEPCGGAVRLADASGARSLPRAQAGVHRGQESSGARDVEPERHSPALGLADAERLGRPARGAESETLLAMGSSGADGLGHFGRRSEADRFWGTVDWLFCQDGKWRPVEPGTLPLAHGAPSRVVRLRAYGNAINAEQATIFVEAFLEKDLCGRSNLTCADDLI